MIFLVSSIGILQSIFKIKKMISPDFSLTLKAWECLLWYDYKIKKKIHNKHIFSL